MNRFMRAALLLPLLLTSACVPSWKTWKWKADSAPIGPVVEPMKPHESWCYRSLGYADCYTRPQNVSPSQLINVDPPSEYPLTPEEYNKALATRRQ